MDMNEAMTLWTDMGNVIVGHSTTDAHYTLFVELNDNKTYGNVMGKVRAEAGGMYWDWPESLLKERRAELEVAAHEHQAEGGE